MSRKRNALVLLAGGRGTRMGTGIHKQFLELGGKPLIWHSLNAAEKSDLIDEIILVSGEDDMAQIRELVSRYGFSKVSMIVKGGEERYLSVINGILAIAGRNGECEAFQGNPEVILVHDGARPFIDDEIIGRCLEGVEETGACVAAVPSKDTVKIADDSNIVTSEPPRRNVWNMQTPQVFRAEVLFEASRKALEDKGSREITDDAQMVNLYTGIRAKLVMGSYENIKITTPVDVTIAGKILEDKIGHIS